MRRVRPYLEILEDRTVPSTLTVLLNTDSGTGSLRQAILDATSGDTIDFDSALTNQTITLTSGALLVNKDLTFTGLGASHLSISGNDASRVLDISNATVTLSDLTITHGRTTGSSHVR